MQIAPRWVSEPVWKLQRREISLAPVRIKTLGVFIELGFHLFSILTYGWNTLKSKHSPFMEYNMYIIMFTADWH
jgi:hypothetical protein